MPRWLPTMGVFEIETDRIRFKGGAIQPNEPGKDAIVHAGILISDQPMTNGRLTANVSFERITDSTVCELILGYDRSTQSHVSAGLGGSRALFSVREWVMPTSLATGTAGASQGGWRNILLGGDRTNLRSNVSYEISARVEGSVVRLDIDGVPAVETTLPSRSAQARQVGIFCLGEGDIVITGFRAVTEQPRAFIVMQFSSPYNEVYTNVIKEICEELHIDALRADEIYGHGMIIKDVIDRIAASHVVIADISPTNANVYFEVGYALALGKPIILLAQTRKPDSPLPFDLSAFRVQFYDDSIGGKPKLELGLRNHLNEVLGRT